MTEYGTVTIPISEYRELVEASAIAEIKTTYEAEIIRLNAEIESLNKKASDAWLVVSKRDEEIKQLKAGQAPVTLEVTAPHDLCRL